MRAIDAVEHDLLYVHDEEDPLPDGWKVTTLEGLISDGGLFCDGDWVESKDQDPNGDVRLIQLADIGVAVYRDRSDRYLTGERASALSCTFLQRGDILVARMPDPLGRACLFPGDKKRAVTVVDVAVIRPNNPEVDCRWLMHRINSMAFRNAMASLQSGSTRLRISRRNLSRIAFPLPPLAVQLAVVDELEKQFSRLDEAVANLQHVKANLKRYKASVLKAAVEGRLVGTEGGWRQSTLGDEGAIIGGLTKNQKRNDLPLKLPYLRVANVYANELRLAEIEYIGVSERELEKLLVRKGDLLVVEGNGSPDQIGRVALWNDSIPNCVHQNHLIKVRFGEAVVPEWALIWMLSPVGRHEIEQVSASTSGLHTLSVGKVSRLPIGVPSKKEQVRIVAEVDRHLSIIREVEAEVDANLQRAQALRQSTLAKAFSS